VDITEQRRTAEIHEGTMPDLRDSPLSSLAIPGGVADETVGRVLMKMDKASGVSVATFNSYI
jgi:FXSXX-COOH protein